MNHCQEFRQEFPVASTSTLSSVNFQPGGISILAIHNHCIWVQKTYLRSSKCFSMSHQQNTSKIIISQASCLKRSVSFWKGGEFEKGAREDKKRGWKKNPQSCDHSHYPDPPKRPLSTSVCTSEHSLFRLPTTKCLAQELKISQLSPSSFSSSLHLVSWRPCDMGSSEW